MADWKVLALSELVSSRVVRLRITVADPAAGAE